MTRNLKALGLALVAVFAMSAFAAQGVSAHQFHSDGPKVNSTGKILGATPHKFSVGTAGTVECTSLVAEGTDIFTQIDSSNTYEADEVTVVPHYSGCTFGGNPATVNFNHCAYKFDSDTTEGNTTIAKSQHANVEIECKDKPIEITTSICTLTVGEQLVKHGVAYENDPDNKNAIIIRSTAHSIVVGNLNDKGTCVLVPKGAVGKYVGDATSTCYEDKGSTPSETEKTTPTEKLEHGPETECKLAP